MECETEVNGVCLFEELQNDLKESSEINDCEQNLCWANVMQVSHHSTDSAQINRVTGLGIFDVQRLELNRECMRVVPVIRLNESG